MEKPIKDIVFRGGKRMRPILFLTLLQGFGVNYKPFLKIAAFLEIVHNGTLVIDDIEDNSSIRRGKKTLHKIYGLDIAVNTGVAMHVLPLSILLNNKTITDRHKLRLYEIYSSEITALYFGQATDIYWHRSVPEQITPSLYFEMCRLKTGALMRMSAKYACVIADQDLATEQAFASFAETAGISFQIIDDVLDLEADPTDFGKAYGNDISEGKISLPVIIALDELVQEKANRLKEILSMHTTDKDSIDEARTLILNTNAIAKSKKQANKLYTTGLQTITNKLPDNEGLKNLEGITQSFIKRTH
jgi:geranylgeranyl pyrophosphate synthase